MLLGIDLGGTKLAAALVDDEGRVLQKLREPVDQKHNRSVVEQLSRVIESFAGSQPEAVGICIPGIADSKSKTVWAPNIKGWDHIPLAQLLSARVSIPIVIESDRNAAVLGEALYGAAVGKSDVVFLIIGTGIGAGILAGGRILRGSHDIGGAIGWIPVWTEEEKRHFEDVAAGPAIEREAHELFHLEGCKLPQLLELARGGHERVQELLATAGKAIGQVLSVLVSTFNPEMIVLGGGVSHAWDLLAPSALETMHLWSQPIAVRQVEIVVSALGEDAGILGAAAAARHAISKPA